MEKQTENVPRLAYLDSVRGIAALMVFFCHYINWKYADQPSVKIATIFFNGNDAVSFFFVLSGMVLSYPYIQLNKSLDIGKYYIARVFRIYPGFWVALILNALFVIYWKLGINSSFKDIFILNKDEFWNEFLLIRGFNRFYLPGWTLTIEICFSFLMPFLILVAKYNRKLLPWLLLASFLAINVTGLFLFHFVLGIIIASYFDEIRQDSFAQTRYYRYRIILLIAAAFMFSLRPIFSISPLGSTLVYILSVLKLDMFLFSGTAAFIFLVFLIHSKRAQRFFEHPVLLFYGKISYGVYLMHWVFVWAMGDYWDAKILPLFPGKTSAFLTVMLVCFLLTTASATLLHYFIELPFMKMGKRVAGRIKNTVSI